jgi:hypothetical protein
MSGLEITFTDPGAHRLFQQELEADITALTPLTVTQLSCDKITDAVIRLIRSYQARGLIEDYKKPLVLMKKYGAMITSVPATEEEARGLWVGSLMWEDPDDKRLMYQQLCRQLPQYFPRVIEEITR